MLFVVLLLLPVAIGAVAFDAVAVDAVADVITDSRFVVMFFGQSEQETLELFGRSVG